MASRRSLAREFSRSSPVASTSTASSLSIPACKRCISTKTRTYTPTYSPLDRDYLQKAFPKSPFPEKPTGPVFRVDPTGTKLIPINPPTSAEKSTQFLPQDKIISHPNFSAESWSMSKDTPREALLALAARIGVSVPKNEVSRERLALSLESCLTHPSYDPSIYAEVSTAFGTNELGSFLGKKILDLCAIDYITSKYPNLPMKYVDIVREALVGEHSCVNVARTMGVSLPGLKEKEKLKAGFTEGGVKVRWNTKAEPEISPLVPTLHSLLSLLYSTSGLPTCVDFIHAHFFTRVVDLPSLIKFENPEEVLRRAVEGKFGMEIPVARLLKETGRASHTPVFVVGFFSGEVKLGEGFGTSLKMARFRAATASVLTFVLTANPSPTLSTSSFSAFPLSTPPDSLAEAAYRMVASIQPLGVSEVVAYSSSRKQQEWLATEKQRKLDLHAEATKNLGVKIDVTPTSVPMNPMRLAPKWVPHPEDRE